MAKDNVIGISGHVETVLTEDQFYDRFMAFCEKNNCLFTGIIILSGPVDSTKNKKQ